MSELSVTLKTLREKKDVSMDQMCLDLKNNFGVSIAKSTISKWENGKAEPSLAYARILAKYFNVTLDCIIGVQKDDSEKDGDIERIERAREKMDDDDKEAMMKVLEAAFAKYFND